MVEQLMRRGLKVTVVEMLPQVLGPLDVEMAAIIEEDMQRKGVTVVTGDGMLTIWFSFHPILNFSRN